MYVLWSARRKQFIPWGAGTLLERSSCSPRDGGSTLIQGWSLTKSDEDRSLGASAGARRRPSLILSSIRGCLSSWGRRKRLRLEAGVVFGISFYFSVSQEYVWHSFGRWGLRISAVFIYLSRSHVDACVEYRVKETLIKHPYERGILCLKEIAKMTQSKVLSCFEKDNGSSVQLRL